MMLTATIYIKQIDEVFPALIETLQVRRNIFRVSELPIVRVDLVFHPAQVFDRFAFAPRQGIIARSEG